MRHLASTRALLDRKRSASFRQPQRRSSNGGIPAFCSSPISPGHNHVADAIGGDARYPSGFGEGANCSATSRLARAMIVRTGGMPQGSGMTLESHT